MISKRQYTITYFYILRALFLGTSTSLIIGLSGNATFLSCIIGFLLGLIFNIFIYYVNKKKKDLNIVEVFDKGFIAHIGKILLFLVGLVILNNSLVAVTTMTNSFYLIKTPAVIISGTILFIAYYSIRKGIKGFIRCIEILFPALILLFIIKVLFFGTMFNINNYKPFLDSDKVNIFKGSIIFFANTALPSLLMLNFKNTDYTLKDNFKGYIIGSGSVVIFLILIVGVLGLPIAKVLRYPEYMILKNINFLNFIENIENLLNIAFIIDNIIIIVLSAFLCHNVIVSYVKGKTVIKIFDILFLGMMMLLCVKVFNNSYINTLYLYKYDYLVFLILLGLTSSIIFYKIKKSC